MEVVARFCISLLTFTNLAKRDGKQTNVFFVLLISSGHVLKQDVVNVYGMHSYASQVICPWIDNDSVLEVISLCLWSK